MYEMTSNSRKAEKQFIQNVNDKIKERLELLKENPRKNLDAHSLHGKMRGKWSCWFGSNQRMVYELDDINKLIIVFAVGSHKIYQ
jgi:addiction module RelE/StbE family toxin|tara:strand:- start:364 stop:618 length:255 start_codon:yes stop_codon:yes gene_type:complete